MYPKDTEKWKQFTTRFYIFKIGIWLLCIPKILKNESNSQPKTTTTVHRKSCCVSQRYWKMKAIHNKSMYLIYLSYVVVYPKDTEKWKQFTTPYYLAIVWRTLLCIPKILKNESNSQRFIFIFCNIKSCCVSQRYWKMKAIHN